MKRRKPATLSAALVHAPQPEPEAVRDYPRLTWGGYGASLKGLVEVEGAFEEGRRLEWDRE